MVCKGLLFCFIHTIIYFLNMNRMGYISYAFLEPDSKQKQMIGLVVYLHYFCKPETLISRMEKSRAAVGGVTAYKYCPWTPASSRFNTTTDGWVTATTQSMYVEQTEQRNTQSLCVRERYGDRYYYYYCNSFSSSESAVSFRLFITIGH